MSEKPSSTTSEPETVDLTLPIDPNDFIMLRVIGGDGDEYVFRVRKTRGLERLKRSYSEQVKQSLIGMRFLYDGQRIKDTDTPQKLEMSNGDVIEVFIEQTGG